MEATAIDERRERAESGAAVCALVREHAHDVEAFFARIVEGARRAGLNVVGALQQEEARSGARRCDMFLRDLGSGRLIRISEDRGELAQGCRLDASALVEAAALIEGAIRGASPDLVVLNKFGKAEAEEGGGLRDAIAAALESDVPVLIAVAPSYVPALADFAGDLCVVVADEEAVWRWLAARLGERAPHAEEPLAP